MKSKEIAKVEVVHDGWGRFLVVSIYLEDGQLVRREVEDHGNAVGVLAYDAIRRVAILVKQFRAPMFYTRQLESTTEVIAGGVLGNDPEVCIRREAIEEAGLRLRTLEHVVTGMSMPGVSTMCIDLYLAPYQKSDRVGEGGGLIEEREDITVVEMPLRELADLVDNGGIIDLTTAFLVQTLRLRRPALFERDNVSKNQQRRPPLKNIPSIAGASSVLRDQNLSRI
jgi:nudix-type nucleoside diphosphatase (YffH/AdpP family)